ncbi:hypothetical protein HK100_006037 [Physocladia obscura]|uniref:Uncharacterized protein n=1 Tax=Physocladia obscura TaxID=109957 RepID=A0AAD5T5N5_9FUNG|nr:hypothetical protein HK100_006037 [Physocladia obscura]
MSPKHVGTNCNDYFPQTQKQEALYLVLDFPVPPTPSWPSPPVSSSSSSFRRASTVSTIYATKPALLGPGGINILESPDLNPETQLHLHQLSLVQIPPLSLPEPVQYAESYYSTGTRFQPNFSSPNQSLTVTNYTPHVVPVSVLQFARNASSKAPYIYPVSSSSKGKPSFLHDL